MFRKLKNKQKQKEDKLEQLYLELHEILKKSPLGIYVVNHDGSIDYVNPAMLKISGDSRQQFMDLNIFELDTYEKIGLSEKIKSALEGNHFSMKEVEYSSYFGKKHTIRNFYGMPLEERGLKKALIFVEDVTEQKDIENELKRMNLELNRLTELKSEFVSTVSHELRTPLAITKEGISLIIDGALGQVNNEQKKILVVARDNVDRLARLIDSLLDISKIESGKVELKKQLINVVDVVREIIYSFGLKIKEKNLEIKTDFQKEQIEVYGDRDKIKQIFTNLISNAVKFSEKGSIEVSIKEEDGEIECSVIDTGAGISQEDLPKVFGRFQQFGRTYGPGEKGTGLGLSITKALIELHNGRIWVDSQLGKGSKFSFSLPKRPLTFNELIIDNLKGVMRNHPSFSLVMASLNQFEQLRLQIPDEKINFVLRGVKYALESRLPRGDIILNDIDKLAIILIECNKDNAQKVKERIEHIAQDYIYNQGFADKITLNFGCATYPADASTESELIDKAENI
jgi:PAS domain S-box-containing protein